MSSAAISTRKEQPVGTCEWEPDLRAIGDIREGIGTPCPNAATISVGADGMWHLCASCATLPIFNAYRKRVPLSGGVR